MPLAQGKPGKVKVLEIAGSIDGEDFTDYLVVDENADPRAIIAGDEDIWCQVGTREIADHFVAALNSFRPPENIGTGGLQ
jgi:hypothetical protein